MKSASRNKLLHCFRPIVVDIDAAIEPEPESNSKPQTSLNFNCLIIETTGDEDYCSKALLEKKRTTFSRVVKAVFFETVLAKRVRDKTKSCSFSKSNIKEPRTLDSFVPKFNRTTSSSPSCSSTRSCSDSAKPKHRKINDEGRRDNKAEMVKVETTRRCNMGLYLVLISLAITVLLGRFLAILFTSGCLIGVIFAGKRKVAGERRGINIGHNDEGLAWKERVVTEEFH